MSNEKLIAARSIGKALRPSEDNIDVTIAAVAELVATIAKARLSAGVAFQTGHEAQMHATSALEALATARDHAVACHQKLDGVRADQEIEPDAAGCTLFKTGSQRQRPQLQAVAG